MTTDPSTPPSSAARPQAQSAASRGRLLVVDDNSDSAETLAELLGFDGYETRWVCDGESALKLLTSYVPDLVLLDIGMPVMDGYQLAGALRADPRSANMKLVALTGYERDDERSRTLAADFDDHLVKPVQFERLQEVLGRLLPPSGSG